MTGCSANWHVTKAIKKGYRVGGSADTIQITKIDSFPIIIKDSIIWEKFITTRDTVIFHETHFVPKTRWQYRMDNKRFKDSLKTVKNMYSDSLKAAIKMHRVSAKANVQFIKQKTKQVKHENKNGARLFMLGLVIGIIITLIIKYAINQALKKFA